jgi:hypothetical protein
MQRGGGRQGRTTKRFFFVGLTVAAFCLLSFGCTGDNEVREAELTAEIDSLRAHIRDMKENQKALERELKRVVVEDGRIGGLQLTDIAEDLRSHPELIPFNPVPEGHSKFGFYDPEGIHFLSTEWAMADFDDGHVAGRMLLRFWVDDSGEITWKVLSWTMD